MSWQSDDLHHLLGQNLRWHAMIQIPFLLAIWQNFALLLLFLLICPTSA
jgi:hypothetical protein